MKKLLFCSVFVFYAPPALAVMPDGGEIVFEILRNGSSFGEHRVRFEPQGDKTRVLIDIAMKYALGPVALFRYEHSNEEIWQGDRILSMTSQTDDDGDDYYVDARWGEVLEVEANGEAFDAPARIYTTSYWNPVGLKAGQLLNTQKGIVEGIDVRFEGRGDFMVLDEARKADHYRVNSKLPLDVWYDAKTQQWVGLKFSVRGSEIEYRRLTPIEPKP